MKNPGSQFLHERQPTFHASREVEGVVDYLRTYGDSIPNEPADKISSYLGFLANRSFVNDGILTGDQSSIDRQIESSVIKTGDVPESFFDLQRRIAREQGHGDIQITPELRHQVIEAVQADQREGLAKWVEYLGGEDGGYPDWFKHYVFNSVSKLGSFEKEKHEFLKRSRGTTAVFPELNREALAYVFDVISKSKLQGGQADLRDHQLQKLLAVANFGKLYAHAVLEVTPSSPELRGEVRGSWTRFNQTDDPRTARRLSGSLQGHGTGWCTAGESTATTQLSMGDFYIYYSRDDEGKDTIPRVAVRMQDNLVAEVRGINPTQEMEPIMADIVADKLQELPGGEQYVQKAEDMKRLTAIDKKISADPNAKLSDDELRCLYELDHQIQGFGYETDPRIGEIRVKRGERDKPELSKLLPEAIREQLECTFTGYLTVIEQLGLGQEDWVSNGEFEQLFADKDKQWHADGVYDEIVERLISDGIRFNLLATPNLEVTEQQIVTLAESFGQKQPYSTYIWGNMYRKDQYTSKQWSGASGKAPVKFSLIEANIDSRLSNKTAVDQQEVLAELQAEKPKLGLRVPSLLDAVTNWYALRAKGDSLSDSTAYDKTYVRHFDLDERRIVDVWLFVPSSFVIGDGRPGLYYSVAGNRYDARVLVG